MNTIIPPGYVSILDGYQTQMAIGMIKHIFAERLSQALNLARVSAPLFVRAGTGINDDLNGVERPVSFDIAGAECRGEVVHSLAKWKRLALHRYGFPPGRGLCTDMNAIRRDEVLDNLHSVYVDQWDWERVISAEERTQQFLVQVVERIYSSMLATAAALRGIYPELPSILAPKILPITSTQLCQRWPDLSPKQREERIVRQHGAVFVMQIGNQLPDGTIHDSRAPDYDDWSLNGDILVFCPVLDCAVELSSMGIRVDSVALAGQLDISGQAHRRDFEFHRMLLDGQLPLTIGGGIGQSRLCMLLLAKAHIGEVQASIWDDQTLQTCAQHGVKLL